MVLGVPAETEESEAFEEPAVAGEPVESAKNESEALEEPAVAEEPAESPKNE